MTVNTFIISFISLVLGGSFGSSLAWAAGEASQSPASEKHTHPAERHTHPKRPHLHEELEQIKLWLADIERDTERRPLFKEEKKVEDDFPLQTSRKTRLNGGMTLIFQGGLNNETQFGGDRADGSLSIDLILSSEIRKNGLLIIRGDFMRGEGLTRLPPLFSGGVNADIERFSEDSAMPASDTFHLIEALYEQRWHSETFRLSIGQIDLSSYFDQNQFANSETFQFISPAFVNNIAIGWGGDANGYGPGLVMHAHPVKEFEISLGLFEGDGNYEDLFSQAFWIVEVEYELYLGGLEGHYRLNYWSNETDHNDGIGLSIDQAFSEQVGVWGRFGIQDGAVSEYDRHAAIGLEIKDLTGSSGNVLGIAVAETWISEEYQKATGLFDNERLGEIYYNISAGHGFYFTPDLQYISNPGGRGAIDPITIYGLRGQLDF